MIKETTRKLAKDMNMSVGNTSALVINFIFYLQEQNILTNFKMLSNSDKSIVVQEYVAKCINQLEEFESTYMNGDITKLFDELIIG